MTYAELTIELTELFDDAIANSFDIDWTSKDGARECVRALLADSALLSALAAVEEPA